MVVLQQYPLYDDLRAQVEARSEKSIDIQRICSTVNGLPSGDHTKEIAALILHHELITNDGILLSCTPYNGKLMVGGKGILYSMMDLPPMLQQIIAQYVENSSKQ